MGLFFLLLYLWLQLLLIISPSALIRLVLIGVTKDEQRRESSQKMMKKVETQAKPKRLSDDFKNSFISDSAYMLQRWGFEQSANATASKQNKTVQNKCSTTVIHHVVSRVAVRCVKQALLALLTAHHCRSPQQHET